MIQAKMGVNLKETSFNLDGGGLQVKYHTKFVWHTVGATNSCSQRQTTDLISINAPRKGGINVKYLKHILQKAVIRRTSVKGNFH